MESQLRESDTWFYSIFLHTSASPSPPIHIGSISLRRPPSPTLPPPPSFTGAPPVGTGAPLSDAEVAARQRALGDVDLQIRTLGYALFEAWHGHGFATEAGGALVRAYRGAVGSWSAGRDAGEAGEGGGAQEREAGQGQGQSKLNMEEGDAIKGEEGHIPKPTKFYIEAGVDIDNPGSQRVLQKLGFRSVGMKVEPAKAWLNGAWRGPGWWIAGLYL